MGFSNCLLFPARQLLQEFLDPDGSHWGRLDEVGSVNTQ